jgi:site-specific recombinase XerD
MKGKQPYWPDNLMKRHIQPVAKAIGIHKKIGWHTFRHSFGTLLKANGEDVKTVQELLRHANSRITLDVYTQSVNSNKRAAQSKVVKNDRVRRGSEERRKIPAYSAVTGLLDLYRTLI